MATVRLSDVFIPSVYLSYEAVDSPEKSVLVTAGIAVSSPMMNEIARTGGRIATLPFWNDLDATIEPNYSNDDPADMATPNNVNTGTMTSRKAWLNQGYSAMDLVQELAGSSPMQHIRNRFGTYWKRQMERRLLASLAGILADNIANDGGDMVIDISANAGADALFNSNAFVDAAYTAGDMADIFTVMAVHSSIMARMVKDDEVVYVPDSSGALTIPTYKGRIIITTDMMPVTGSGVNRVYTSVLFGKNGLGFGNSEGSNFAIGEGVPAVPAEVERIAAAGNGGGQETIWERKTWILHPRGFSWNELGGADTITEFSPTLANLAEGKRWNRVLTRKQVGLAFIKSKA